MLSWLEIVERIKSLWEEWKKNPDVSRCLGDLSWEERSLIDARSKIENPYVGHKGADVILDRGTIWARVSYEGLFPVQAEKVGMRIYWAVNVQVMLTPLLVVTLDALDRANDRYPEKKFKLAQGFNPRYFYRVPLWKPELFRAEKVSGDPGIMHEFYEREIVPHAIRFLPVPGMGGYVSTPLIYRRLEDIYSVGEWGFLDQGVEGG